MVSRTDNESMYWPEHVPLQTKHSLHKVGIYTTVTVSGALKTPVTFTEFLYMALGHDLECSECTKNHTVGILKKTINSDRYITF
jgi:hypothetical protein